MRPIIDLPLHGDPSARLLPWIVGVVLYATLLSAGLCASFFYFLRAATPSQNMPHATLAASLDPAEKARVLEQLKEKLPQLVPLKRMGVVPGEEVEQSIQSLFSDSPPSLRPLLASAVLVDVWVTDPDTLSLEALQDKLRQEAPQFMVVGPRPDTLVPVFFGPWVPWVALGLCVLSLCACLGVVAFAVRTAVCIHWPILEILDLMGASSAYIARQFRRHTLHNTLKGMGICVCLLILLILSLGIAFDQLNWFFQPKVLERGLAGLLGFFAVMLVLTRWMTSWMVRLSLRSLSPC